MGCVWTCPDKKAAMRTSVAFILIVGCAFWGYTRYFQNHLTIAADAGEELEIVLGEDHFYFKTGQEQDFEFRVFEYKTEFRPGPMPGHIKLDPFMAIATPLDIHKKFAGGEACEAFSGNASHILQIIPKDPRVKIKIDYAMLRERGAYRCAILRGQKLSFVRQVSNGEDVAQGFRSLIDRRRLDPNQFLLLMDIEPIDCGDGRSS